MAFVVAYVSFFQILTSMGTDTVVVREIARHPERPEEVLKGAASLRIALSISAMTAAWVLIPLVVRDSRLIVLGMLYSTILLFSYSTLYVASFNAELRSHVPNTVLGVWSVAYSVIRLGLVALGCGVSEFLAADVVSALVILLLSRWVMRRYSPIRLRLTVDRIRWRFFVGEAWPIAIATWMMALHLRVDQVLLFRWAGPSEVGGYAAEVRISEIWGSVASAFMASVFPLLARDAMTDGDRLQRTSAATYRYLYVFICPIALALAAYPEWFLGLLFGRGFVDAAEPLRILAAAEVFAFSNAVTFTVLFSAGRQRQAAFIAGVSLIANVVMNVGLIPVQGAIGAAVASLASYAVVPFLALCVPQVRWMGIRAFVALTRPIGATAIAGCVLWLVSPGVLVGLLLIVAVYPLALAVTGAIRIADIRLLADALGAQRTAVGPA
jgi:O-antigen/teichoic acid export membrane protein